MTLASCSFSGRPMPTNPVTTVAVLPPRRAVCRMISTRPRFFFAGFASVRCPESTATDSGAGGSPSLERPSKALLPKTCAASVGIGLRLLMVSGAILIAEIRELQGHGKIFGSDGRDHRLQIVTVLAGHADLLVLNLGGYFEF